MVMLAMADLAMRKHQQREEIAQYDTHSAAAAGQTTPHEKATAFHLDFVMNSYRLDAKARHVCLIHFHAA